MQSCPLSEILSASLRARILPPGSATPPSAGGAEAPLARAALWVLCPCVITGAHAVPRQVANGHVCWGCRCWFCLCCWLPPPRHSPAPPIAASRAGMCSCHGAATRGHLGAPQMAAIGCLPAPSRRRDNCPSAPFIPLMFRACSTSDPSCLPSLMTQIWEIRAALVVSIHSREPVFACASQASEIITRCSAFLGLQSVFLLFPSINMDAQLLLKRINKNKKGQAPNPVCFPSVMQSQCCLCPKFTRVGLGLGWVWCFFPPNTRLRWLQNQNNESKCVGKDMVCNGKRCRAPPPAPSSQNAVSDPQQGRACAAGTLHPQPLKDVFWKDAFRSPGLAPFWWESLEFPTLRVASGL